MRRSADQSTAWLPLTIGRSSRYSMSSMASIVLVAVQLRKYPSASAFVHVAVGVHDQDPTQPSSPGR
jgi:hypothetical protein